MHPSVRNDVLALLAATLAWIVIIWSGAGSWGLFVPLLIAAVIIPAVLTAFLEATPLTRPWLGIVPSLLVAVWAAVFSRDEWETLIWQCMVGGAVVVLVVNLGALLPRKRA